MELSNVISILLYVVLAWFIYQRFAPVKGFKNLSNQEFANKLEQKDKKVLVDVREPSEHQAGHIPHSVNIPLSQLKNRLNEIPKDQDVLLYCRSGMRSKQAGRMLSKHGFRQLSHLQGGISSWTGRIAK